MPLFVVTLLCLFLLPESDKWMVAFPLVLGTTVFMLRHAIEDWWRRKNPSRLDKMERNILDNFFPYYRALQPSLKVDFEQRLKDFRSEKQFQMRGAKTLPGDIQLLISATAIQLSFGQPWQKEFYPNLGMIILYLKTFITPNFNDKLHAIEVNFDKKGYDSVLFSVNMFIEGLKSVKYYNTGLLGFATLWLDEQNLKLADFNTTEEELQDKLPSVRGLTWDFLTEYTATASSKYLLPALMECFFQRPNALRQQLPEVFEALKTHLGQDTTRIDDPVLRKTTD